jgi:hypothetical protein
MQRLLRALVAASAALAVGSAAAQSEARRSVEQKLEFSRTLITGSAVANRIRASGSEEAKALLRQAGEHLAAAEALLSQGDLAAADRETNRAILVVGQARQLAPDDAQRSAEQRARFLELLASTETLAASYERHRKAAAQQASVEWTDAQRQLERARSLQATGQLTEATRLLGDVQRQLMSQMTGLLGNQTIDYTVRFESPRHEFDYELARYRSLEALVPMALKEFNPTASARADVDGHLVRGRQLSEAAQRQVGERPERGVALLREAVAEVQRALGAAGLVVPQ